MTANGAPLESVLGRVVMADGTSRYAYRNTYKVTTFSADGRTAQTERVVRIEFLLDTNAARGTGRRYRKTSPKQAATFREEAI